MKVEETRCVRPEERPGDALGIERMALWLGWRSWEEERTRDKKQVECDRGGAPADH